MTGKIEAQAVRMLSCELMDVVNGTGSKSYKIRQLRSKGLEKSTIANLLGIKYQFVSNVLLLPVTTK